MNKKLDLNKATNKQLENLFHRQHIKYVMSLEDQLQEDKAHLLLKQNTIETLEEDIKVKNNLIRRWQLHYYKSTKKVRQVGFQETDIINMSKGINLMIMYMEEIILLIIYLQDQFLQKI